MGLTLMADTQLEARWPPAGAAHMMWGRAGWVRALLVVGWWLGGGGAAQRLSSSVAGKFELAGKQLLPDISPPYPHRGPRAGTGPNWGSNRVPPNRNYKNVQKKLSIMQKKSIFDPKISLVSFIPTHFCPLLAHFLYPQGGSLRLEKGCWLVRIPLWVGSIFS